MKKLITSRFCCFLLVASVLLLDVNVFAQKQNEMIYTRDMCLIKQYKDSLKWYLIDMVILKKCTSYLHKNKRTKLDFIHYFSSLNNLNGWHIGEKSTDSFKKIKKYIGTTYNQTDSGLYIDTWNYLFIRKPRQPYIYLPDSITIEYWCEHNNNLNLLKTSRIVKTKLK